MSTQELYALITSEVGITARSLLRISVAWRRLESLGEDLSPLRSGLLAYCALIAEGSVLPETVVRFASKPLHFRAVASLPADRQRKLAGGDPVLVVVPAGDRFTHRMIQAERLSLSQLRQVFGDRCVRSEAEQVAMLSSPKAQSAPRKPVRMGRVVVDRQAGTVRIDRVMVPVEDMLAALRSAGVVS